MKRVILGVAGLFAALVLIVPYVARTGRGPLAEADRLYDAGYAGAAADVYKAHFDAVPADRFDEVLGRIVAGELGRGDRPEAVSWARRAVGRRDATFSDPAAAELLAVLRAEEGARQAGLRAAREARRQGELAARAAAEAARRAHASGGSGD